MGQMSLRSQFMYAILFGWLLALAPPSTMPKLPKVIGPIPVTADSQILGAEDVPGGPPSANLPAHGYVEEEYFVSGTANIYQYDSNWNRTLKQANVPYTTRMVIRRPTDRAKFSGTVQSERGPGLQPIERPGAFHHHVHHGAGAERRGAPTGHQHLDGRRNAAGHADQPDALLAECHQYSEHDPHLHELPAERPARRDLSGADHPEQQSQRYRRQHFGQRRIAGYPAGRGARPGVHHQLRLQPDRGLRHCEAALREPDSGGATAAPDGDGRRREDAVRGQHGRRIDQH